MISCAVYYVSLPLLLVFVAGGGGALIYGMFAVGHVPIKLVAIIGLIVFWTCIAAIRSLFFRPSDDEPGLKLNLAESRSLRRRSKRLRRESEPAAWIRST